MNFSEYVFLDGVALADRGIRAICQAKRGEGGGVGGKPGDRGVSGVGGAERARKTREGRKNIEVTQAIAGGRRASFKYFYVLRLRKVSPKLAAHCRKSFIG